MYKVRTGCKDIWNLFMIKGAVLSKNDIPICPTTAKEIPCELVSYTKAKTIYNSHIKSGDKNFFVNAYVHFYIDDQKFDGSYRGIWKDYDKAFDVLRHFAGIITPDFSTYADFPFPIKIFNTYRMRAFGYWYGRFGGAVINNVRWGTDETFSYCFDGIPKKSIVAIGTVASGLKEKKNWKNFSEGLFKMAGVLKPRTIIVYGSDKYPFFDELRNSIQIVHFRSEMDLALRGDFDE